MRRQLSEAEGGEGMSQHTLFGEPVEPVEPVKPDEPHPDEQYEWEVLWKDGPKSMHEKKYIKSPTFEDAIIDATAFLKWWCADHPEQKAKCTLYKLIDVDGSPGKEEIWQEKMP